MYQKWADQSFPLLNFVFSRDGPFGLGGATRSQSALHMHVLVCICGNVRQFHKIIGMIHVCYHTIVCT